MALLNAPHPTSGRPPATNSALAAAGDSHYPDAGAEGVCLLWAVTVARTAPFSTGLHTIRSGMHQDAAMAVAP